MGDVDNREKIEITYMNECYYCINKRNVPGNAHISCVNASKEVKGNDWGIKNGWFIYPFCFDPIWKLNSCPNFKNKNEQV